MIHDNVKKFKIDSSGKVVGVELFIEDVPNQQYVISHLRLIDEYESNNRVSAICTSIDGRTDFYLSYPYRRGNISFQNSLAAGNSNGVHVISNGYTPPNYGYLCIHIGKQPISQIVGGLGLPINRHVSFEIGYSRADANNGGGGTTPNPGNSDFDLLRKRVDKIERYLLSFGEFK